MATLDDQGVPEANETGPAVAEPAPLLFEGQRLDQPTFHELYLQTPDGFRAELIDGVVHVMSSPVSPRHGRPFSSMNGLIFAYAIETPGTITQGVTTAKLGPRDEVQPDCALLIDPAFGGADPRRLEGIHDRESGTSGRDRVEHPLDRPERQEAKL